MPTGYTAGVADGTVTEFKDYALMCARNFGACIMLRDEPLSSVIPEFQPSSWNEGQLEATRKEYEKWCEMIMEERLALYHREIEEKKKRNAAYRQEVAEKKERYSAMLEKAKKFNPPTAEHREYAKFIVEQLEESIQFDCSGWCHEDESLPFDEWERKRSESLVERIGYHAKKWEEEKAMTESRNNWIRRLREAIELVR